MGESAEKIVNTNMGASRWRIIWILSHCSMVSIVMRK